MADGKLSRLPMHVAIYEAGGFDEVESTFELGLRLLIEAVERLRDDAPCVDPSQQ